MLSGCDSTSLGLSFPTHSARPSSTYHSASFRLMSPSQFRTSLTTFTFEDTTSLFFRLSGGARAHNLLSLFSTFRRSSCSQSRGKRVCGEFFDFVVTPKEKGHPRSEEHTSELQSPCNL